FDPTPVDESLLRVIAYCTIVTPNEVEVRRLTGNNEVVDGAKRLLDYGAESVIVKMGERGGFYINREERFFFPSFNVNPVDTTGAGDTFNGSLASALFLGMNIRDAIKYASAASAISVTRKGAATSSPLKEEIINFLEEKGEKVNY
ncbi:MAG: ribokinase, partial [Caldiserica bacterium]